MLLLTLVCPGGRGRGDGAAEMGSAPGAPRCVTVTSVRPPQRPPAYARCGALALDPATAASYAPDPGMSQPTAGRTLGGLSTEFEQDTIEIPFEEPAPETQGQKFRRKFSAEPMVPIGAFL